MAKLTRRFALLMPGLRLGLDAHRLASLQSLVHRFEAVSKTEETVIAGLVRASGDGRHGGSADAARPAVRSGLDSESEAGEISGDIAGIKAIDTSLQKEEGAYRNALSEHESRSQQAALQQTTDAVTQQSNLALSILDQLSTLTSAIFR